MTNEDYVTYETAQALKEAGFDWKCTMAYHHDMYSKHNLETMENALTEQKLNEFTEVFAAPTLAQAQKWLREAHNIHVLPQLESVNRPQYVCHIRHLRKSSERLTDDAKYFDTYESALSAGIEAALKLIEEGTLIIVLRSPQTMQTFKIDNLPLTVTNAVRTQIIQK